MNEVLHANIFFIITSIAVILFTILSCIAVYYVIKILRSIRRIVERVEQGSDSLAQDIADLRSFVLDGGLVSKIAAFFFGVKAMHSRRRKKSNDDEND